MTMLLPRRDDREGYEDVVVQDCYEVEKLTHMGTRPVVVDIGAHVGTFAFQVRRRYPGARIICAECAPENLPLLAANVGGFAKVVAAAVTYESEDVFLLNCNTPGSANTMGSEVLTRKQLQDHIHNGENYFRDFRPMAKATLEEMVPADVVIDLLKLDCECSEYSILGKSPSLDRVRVIVGEYHGSEQWAKLVDDRFAGWKHEIMRSGVNGLFRLTNPRFFEK